MKEGLFSYDEVRAAVDAVKKEAKEKGYVDTDIFEKVTKDVSKERTSIAKKVTNEFFGIPNSKGGLNTKKDVKHYMIAVPKGGLNSLNWYQRAFIVQGMVYSVCCIPCETMLCDIETFKDIAIMFFWATEECVETLKKHLIECKFCSCWISDMQEQSY